MVEQVLAGRVALVTGAARGMGAGVARGLAAHGARVALVGLEPEQLAEQAQRCGNGSRAWTADVTDQARMTEVANEVREQFGRIDVLVANAGVATGGTLRIADPAAYDRVIEVNLLGSVRTARAVLPHLIESRGYYLQIASAAALLPTAVMASYAASKSGVEAFAHAVSGEVLHLGVDVGIGYLIWTDSDMTSGIGEHPALKAAHDAMPWPVNRVYPAQPAIDALVDGVLRRKGHVMAPKWLWFTYWNRAASALLAPRIANRFARRAEAEYRRHPEQIGLVGAGGAADANRGASDDA
ncbi:SDR family oxidoreductase [Spongisporangium articulatum]|uniref:SDR family oxidoreductase n=1 Tax=Spongisporangium articulatum TaxID=3362603 RepID=A0ABW8AJX7_9ACTN